MTPYPDMPFPDLRQMIGFAEAWPQSGMVQQLVGRLHSGYNFLLCKTKSRLVAEYALRDVNKPMGVAEYNLAAALLADLKTSLPSIEQIERELGGEVEK
jgi:hypothetical protein